MQKKVKSWIFHHIFSRGLLRPHVGVGTGHSSKHALAHPLYKSPTPATSSRSSYYGPPQQVCASSIFSFLLRFKFLLFWELVLISICNKFHLMSIEYEQFSPLIELTIKLIDGLEFEISCFQLLRFIFKFFPCTKVSIRSPGYLSTQVILLSTKLSLSSFIIINLYFYR